MRYALFALPVLLAAAPALAQAPAEPTVNQQIVYGDDPCTESGNADEIVICVRMPEEERFRIPPSLRDNPNNPANQAWANRATELSYLGRTGAESCSTVGGGGFTGCFNQLVRQARAERATDETVNWNQLIDQARQERLRRIDEQIMSEEDNTPLPTAPQTPQTPQR